MADSDPPSALPTDAREIRIRPGSFLTLVWCAIALVIVAGIGREIGAGLAGVPSSQFDWQLFWLDGEANLPSWISAVLLLTAATMLWCQSVVQRGKRDAGYWRLLSVGFFYLSADEGAQLHERLQTVLPPMSDWLLYTWVAVAIPAVLVVGMAFLPFLFRLPARTAIGFFCAGIVYVAGALGMELIAGRFVTYLGGDTSYYLLAMVLEESLELVGIGIFLTTLTRHLAQAGTSLRLRLA